MPIIIDANRASDFTPPPKHHAPEILQRVAARRMRVAVGGRLLRELALTKLRSLLAEWARAGCLVRVDDTDVDDEETRQLSLNLNSDDPHVIALAIVSGARLLYTEDAALISDFKDPLRVQPRGKVTTTTTPARVALPLFDRFGT